MRRVLLIITLFVVLIIPQAWGATRQYPDPYRQTLWNNMTDTIHTIGQTPQKAKSTKMKLHAARTKARLRSISKARRQAWLQSHNK